MGDLPADSATNVTILWWVARLSAVLAIIPLMLVVFGESGTGPTGFREWAYLALFPFGFSIGYLAGWRWPLLGGCVSLGCMLASLLVVGRVFDGAAYLTWAALSVPGILYVVVAWLEGSESTHSGSGVI